MAPRGQGRAGVSSAVLSVEIRTMRFRLFQYPLPADPELQDLNAFVASRRVATVSHHVVTQVSGGLLLFVVETVGDGAARSSAAGTARVDYRELLSSEDFALFSKLRSERRRVAEAEGVPVYTVFSNAQLAEMVQKRVTHVSAMGDIEGVGKARVEKYAPRFLPILSEAFVSATGTRASEAGS
jgi:superfamily II DNA helicase RecQ